MSTTHSGITGHSALKSKPTAWCCVKAAAIVGAGAVFWAGVVIVVMRAAGS